jgi:hypothetical protein
MGSKQVTGVNFLLNTVLFCKSMYLFFQRRYSHCEIAKVKLNAVTCGIQKACSQVYEWE